MLLAGCRLQPHSSNECPHHCESDHFQFQQKCLLLFNKYETACEIGVFFDAEEDLFFDALDTIASLDAPVPTAPTSALRPLKYTTHLVINCRLLRAVLVQFAELEQENCELEMNKPLRPLPCTRLIFTDCTANNNEVTAPGSSASTNPILLPHSPSHYKMSLHLLSWSGRM